MLIRDYKFLFKMSEKIQVLGKLALSCLTAWRSLMFERLKVLSVSVFFLWALSEEHCGLWSTAAYSNLQ